MELLIATKVYLPFSDRGYILMNHRTWSLFHVPIIPNLVIFSLLDLLSVNALLTRDHMNTFTHHIKN